MPKPPQRQLGTSLCRCRAWVSIPALAAGSRGHTLTPGDLPKWEQSPKPLLRCFQSPIPAVPPPSPDSLPARSRTKPMTTRSSWWEATWSCPRSWQR